MKTTFDLEDGLLLRAKEVALKRRTTLRAVVEGALRRELRLTRDGGEADEKVCYEMDEHGLPVLKRDGRGRHGKVTPEMIAGIREKEGI